MGLLARCRAMEVCRTPWPAGTASRRLLLKGLALPMLLGPCWFSAATPAAAEVVYLNTYGSGWALWARGHSVRQDTGRTHVLKIRDLSLEPNHRYPQTFEIEALRLAYSYLDRTSGELVAPGNAGPPIPYKVTVSEGEKQVIENVTLEVPRGQAARDGEVVVVELHLVTRSGGFFVITVGEN